MSSDSDELQGSGDPCWLSTNSQLITPISTIVTTANEKIVRRISVSTFNMIRLRGCPSAHSTRKRSAVRIGAEQENLSRQKMNKAKRGRPGLSRAT